MSDQPVASSMLAGNRPSRYFQVMGCETNSRTDTPKSLELAVQTKTGPNPPSEFIPLEKSPIDTNGPSSADIITSIYVKPSSLTGFKPTESIAQNSPPKLLPPSTETPSQPHAFQWGIEAAYGLPSGTDEVNRVETDKDHGINFQSAREGFSDDTHTALEEGALSSDGSPCSIAPEEALIDTVPDNKLLSSSKALHSDFIDIVSDLEGEEILPSLSSPSPVSLAPRLKCNVICERSRATPGSEAASINVETLKKSYSSPVAQQSPVAGSEVNKDETTSRQSGSDLEGVMSSTSPSFGRSRYKRQRSRFAPWHHSALQLQESGPVPSIPELGMQRPVKVLANKESAPSLSHQTKESSTSSTIPISVLKHTEDATQIELPKIKESSLVAASLFDEVEVRNCGLFLRANSECQAILRRMSVDIASYQHLRDLMRNIRDDLPEGLLPASLSVISENTDVKIDSSLADIHLCLKEANFGKFERLGSCHVKQEQRTRSSNIEAVRSKQEESSKMTSKSRQQVRKSLKRPYKANSNARKSTSAGIYQRAASQCYSPLSSLSKKSVGKRQALSIPQPSNKIASRNKMKKRMFKTAVGRRKFANFSKASEPSKVGAP